MAATRGTSVPQRIDRQQQLAVELDQARVPRVLGLLESLRVQLRAQVPGLRVPGLQGLRLLHEREDLDEDRLAFAQAVLDLLLETVELTILRRLEVAIGEILVEPRETVFGNTQLGTTLPEGVEAAAGFGHGGTRLVPHLLTRRARVLDQDGGQEDQGQRRRSRASGRGRVATRPLPQADVQPGPARGDRVQVEDRLEVVRQETRARVAPVGILLERFQRHDLEIARNRRVAAPRRLGAQARISRKSCSVVSPSKGTCPVAHSYSVAPSEKMSVGGPIGVFPRTDLLRRRVLRRALEFAGARQPRLLQVARETEVEQHRAPLGRDAHVRRLHVAVHDAGRMRALESARDVAAPPDEGRDRQLFAAPRRFVQDLVQPAAGDELHREVADAALLACRVQGDDAFVTQASDGQGLAVEARRESGAGPRSGAQDLEGNEPLQRALLGQVHDAHAALAEPADQAESADAFDGQPLARLRFRVEQAEPGEHAQLAAQRVGVLGVAAAEVVDRFRAVALRQVQALDEQALEEIGRAVLVRRRRRPFVSVRGHCSCWRAMLPARLTRAGRA